MFLYLISIITLITVIFTISFEVTKDDISKNNVKQIENFEKIEYFNLKKQFNLLNLLSANLLIDEDIDSQFSLIKYYEKTGVRDDAFLKILQGWKGFKTINEQNNKVAYVFVKNINIEQRDNEQLLNTLSQIAIMDNERMIKNQKSEVFIINSNIFYKLSKGSKYVVWFYL